MVDIIAGKLIILPMQVKKAFRDPSVRPGARSCNPLGSGSSLFARERAYCRLEGFPPCALSPSS